MWANSTSIRKINQFSVRHFLLELQSAQTHDVQTLVDFFFLNFLLLVMDLISGLF